VVRARARNRRRAGTGRHAMTVRATRFPRIRPAARFVALLAFEVASAAVAGDVFSGRFYTVPEQPFVNQPFTVHFEVEVTAGGEIDDLRIGNFPNNPDIVSIGQLESKSRNRISRDGQAMDVLHFTAQARGLRPISQTFTPTLQCLFVERRTSGFFSHWQSYPRQKTLAPFTLAVQPLPTVGRPVDFSGAVGVFRLTGHLSQTVVQPGDIVTLHLDLSGQGWLGNAALPTLPSSAQFKTYPAKETVREPLHLAADQVLIPNGTNAAEIAAVRVSYFNPNEARYEETVAGPFRLSFTREAALHTEAVRVINTAATPTTARATVGELAVDPSAVVARQARPLIAACLTGAIGLWLLFTLFDRHRFLAVFACLVVFVLGGFATRAIIGREAAAALPLSEAVDVRFAPSATSEKLFSLNAGTAVVPVERAAGWTRVDAQGRRGWIPGDKLSRPVPPGAMATH